MTRQAYLLSASRPFSTKVLVLVLLLIAYFLFVYRYPRQYVSFFIQPQYYSKNALSQELVLSNATDNVAPITSILSSKMGPKDNSITKETANVSADATTEEQRTHNSNRSPLPVDLIPSDDWLQQCVQHETENPINYQKKYRAQWPQYQLGDCLKMCKSCTSSVRRSKLKDLSIVGQYWKNVCHKKEFSETFNITFLSELFDKYQVNPHPYSQPWPKPADDELVIHLRIGDVIDEPQFSGNTTVYQMLRNGADTRHGKNSIYRNGIKSVGEYLSTIRASGLNKVVLRGGSHFAKVYPKSRIFTACLAKTIERAGFNITSFRVDGEANPDQDFFYMSHAKHFVLATGGYSRLISRMVEYRGGSVISSAPNQGNSA